MPSRSCGVVEDVGLDPSGRRAGRGGQPRGELEHPRAEVDADDLVRAEVPQRQRVAPAGALEVDRPPAAAVKVADEVVLDREQVRATGPDQRDRLVEPALVALGGLVPGRAVRGVHRRDVGGLLRASRDGRWAWRARASCARESTRSSSPESRRPPSIGRRPIIVPGPGADTGPVRQAVGARGPDRRAQPARRRSTCCPRGGWSPCSKLRAMRLRSRATGGTPASAVASRALGPFASSCSGTSGDLHAGRRLTP